MNIVYFPDTENKAYWFQKSGSGESTQTILPVGCELLIREGSLSIN